MTTEQATGLTIIYMRYKIKIKGIKGRVTWEFSVIVLKAVLRYDTVRRTSLIQRFRRKTGTKGTTKGIDILAHTEGQQVRKTNNYMSVFV